MTTRRCPMPTWITTEDRKWKDVAPGETIETPKGQRFEVTSNAKSKEKGFRVVKIKGPGGVFTKKVESKKKAAVILVNGKSAGKGKGIDFGKLAREQEAEKAREAKKLGAAQGVERYTPDPWKVDPADTLYAKVAGGLNAEGGGPWEKPADKAEARAVAILGAKMIGVQTEPGGVYAVPIIDRSAIRAHLLLMHGIEPKGLTEDESLARHNAEHERPIPELFVPHHHSKERPS
jgi:hypothetical protein